MESNAEIKVEPELTTFSDEKKNPFLHTIGFVNFSYLDIERRKFCEIDKLGILISPYLFLTTPNNLQEDIIANDTTFFKFFPIKNKELTSNIFQNKNYPLFIRFKVLDEKIEAYQINETNFGFCILSNSLGEVLIDSNNCVNAYLKLSPFSSIIDEKNQINTKIKLLFLCNKSKNIKGNILFEYKNDNYKKCIYLIDLINQCFIEEDTNNIYLFTNETIDQNGEGFIITNNFTIIGTFINNLEPTIFNKNEFDLKGNFLNDKETNFKTAFLINEFKEIDSKEFDETKKSLEYILGLETNNYSYTDYKDLETFIFKNREPSKEYSELLLSSGVYNIVQKDSTLSLIGLDTDIIMRKILNENFQNIELEKFNLINKKLKEIDINTIFSYLYFDNNLRSLNLSSVKLNKEIWNHISYFLYKNCSLKELTLRNINCHFSSLLSIVTALIDNENNIIQFLDLSNNKFIKDNYFKNDLSFLGQICRLKNLNNLKLSNIANFQKDNKTVTISFLKSIFFNSNESVNFSPIIKVFDISGMDLSDINCIKILIDFISQFGNLETLIISNCNIDDKCFKELINLFKEKDILIKNLDVSNNNLTTESQKNIKNLFNSMIDLIKVRQEKTFGKLKKNIIDGNYSLNLNNNIYLNKYNEGDDFGIMFNVNGESFPKKFTLELENTNVNKKTLEALFNNLDKFTPSILNLSYNDLKDDDIIDSNILSKLCEKENFEVLILKSRKNNNQITKETLLTFQNFRINNSILICDYIKGINNFDYNFVKFVKKKIRKKKNNNN